LFWWFERRVRPFGLEGEKSDDETTPFCLLVGSARSGSYTDPWLESDLLIDLEQLELLSPASIDTEFGL